MAVDRIGKVDDISTRDRLFFLRRRGRAGKPQQHRGGARASLRRFAAAVIDMAAHAGAGVEERPETIGGLRRGGSGNPELAEERVAELKILLFVEGDVGRNMREAVLGDGVDRGRRPCLHRFVLFCLGKIRRWPGDVGDTFQIGRGKVAAFRRQIETGGDADGKTGKRGAEHCAGDQSAGRGMRHFRVRAAPAFESARLFAYLKTALGLSKLSEPSS